MLKDLGARLACQYRIKIGGLSPEKRLKQGRQKGSQNRDDYWQPPQKWDHFKVCKNERGPDGNFIVANEIMQKYGPKPTAINVVLFSDNLKDVYNDFRAMYKGRKCQCRSEDGETARWNAQLAPVPTGFEKTGTDAANVIIKCPGDQCHYAKQEQCKINVLLRCMIAEAPSLGGAAEFRATSVNSALQIRGSLALLHRLTGGHVSGIPLQLTLQPRSTEKGVVYVVHLAYDSDVISLKQKALEYATSAHEVDTKLIGLVSVDGYQETENEIEGIVKEYYPEAVEAEVVEEKPATEAPKTEPPPKQAPPPPAEKPKRSTRKAAPPPARAGEQKAPLTEQEPPIEALFDANEQATGTEAQAIKIPDCPTMGQTVLVDFCHTMCGERGTCQAYIRIMGEEDKGAVDYATVEPGDTQAPAAEAAQQQVDLF